MWYIAALCTKLGLNLNEVMEDNIAKLEERYPGGFTSEDSVKRVDVGVKEGGLLIRKLKTFLPSLSRPYRSMPIRNVSASPKE